MIKFSEKEPETLTLGDLNLLNGVTTLFKVEISGDTYKVHADTKFQQLKSFIKIETNLGFSVTEQKVQDVF